MKKCFTILIFLALNFQSLTASAQTCLSFYRPLTSVSAWKELLNETGNQPGAISTDGLDNVTLNSKGYAKLQKQLQRLAAHPEDLNSKTIERIAEHIAEQLYTLVNESENEKLSFSELGADGSRMKVIHKGIFIQIMKSDLKIALQDYLLVPKPPFFLLKPFIITKDKFQAFIKRNSLKIRAGIWASIHAPLFYFGHFYPLYLVRNGPLKIQTQTIDLVRKELEIGDYNSALRSIKSHLDQTYAIPHARNQIYGAVQGSYNTISALILAHFIMTSGLVQHYVPMASRSYADVVVPVVDVVDERVVTPFMNSVQRLYTNREKFETLVIEKALKQKEEVLGHKIYQGSQEYMETVKHVKGLEFDMLEQFYLSMK